MTTTGALPIRPMTVGETMDTAASVLRLRWKSLFSMAFCFAFVEQIFMTTLRLMTIDEVRPKYYGDLYSDGWMLWLWIVVGLTSEIFVITLLSGPATVVVSTVARGDDPAKLPFWVMSARRWQKAGAYAAGLALLGLVSASLLYLPWFAVYVLFGLAVPALMMDRLPVFRAIVRSPVLVKRGGSHTVGTQLLSVLTWMVLRGIVAYGAWRFVTEGYIDFSTVLFDYFLIVIGVVFLFMNTACYAMLACVQAVTHFESRVRTEGLDIVIARMSSAGKPINLSAPEAR